MYKRQVILEQNVYLTSLAFRLKSAVRISDQLSPIYLLASEGITNVTESQTTNNWTNILLKQSLIEYMEKRSTNIADNLNELAVES